MTRLRRATVLVALLGLLAAAACGVQNDASPRPLAAKDVPFDLLAPATTAANAQNAQGVPRTVWFVDNNGLLATSRRPLVSPITPESILNELLKGVTDAEANNGLHSNITPGTKLLSVKGPENGLVTANFSGELLTVSRELQRLALAQVVFTVTGLPNVDRVLFEFDGKPVSVPGRGQELTSDPLTRTDFAQFDPTATTTTIQP